MQTQPFPSHPPPSGAIICGKKYNFPNSECTPGNAEKYPKNLRNSYRSEICRKNWKYLSGGSFPAAGVRAWWSGGNARGGRNGAPTARRPIGRNRFPDLATHGRASWRWALPRARTAQTGRGGCSPEMPPAIFSTPHSTGSDSPTGRCPPRAMTALRLRDCSFRPYAAAPRRIISRRRRRSRIVFHTLRRRFLSLRICASGSRLER